MTFRRSVQLSVFVSRCLCSGAELATWDCGEMAARDPGQESHPVCAPGSASQIIFAWAMDAPELELPPGVGFRVGGGSSIKYLVLQVHYASTDYIDAAGDDSGVILRYTEQELPKTAGVLLMGTGGSAPAHSTTYFETSCDIEDSRVIHPFAFRTHTHSLGEFRTEFGTVDSIGVRIEGDSDLGIN